MSDYKRNPRGARRARKSLSRKALVVLSLMMVLVMAAVGGTVAWLTATTDSVQNTFTTAGVKITLEETLQSDNTPLEANEEWSAQLVPGNEYTKNPVVAVVDGETDVDVWLFVKVDETNVTFTAADNTTKKYIDYTLTMTQENSGWSKGDGTSIPANVYYREVKNNAADQSWNLLVGNKVTVNSELTKEEIAAATTASKLPSLTFTAYACQSANRDAVQAWDAVKPVTP